MIDFENTRSRGLQGAEYLQADDAVTIFYSQSCMKIERKRVCQLREARCGFHICKLQKAGKNALDFYIASRIGEIYGRGYTGMTAIVSNDTGFQAVGEYWKSCAAVSGNIILRWVLYTLKDFLIKQLGRSLEHTPKPKKEERKP